MNTFFSTIILELTRPGVIDKYIAGFVVFVIILLYLIPTIAVVKDIYKRYQNKYTRASLIVATFLFPIIFVVGYSVLKKSYTLEEENLIQKELQIQSIALSTKDCPKCNSVCKSADSFCHTCGFKIEQKCTSCSSIIEMNWNYCTSCGFQMRTRPIDPKEIAVKDKSYRLLNSIGYKISLLGLSN